MALHEKKQDRHEAFFLQQLDRKEHKTAQLRLELNETQQKLKDMVRRTREAERQLRVDQVDVEHQKSLLRVRKVKIGKITQMLRAAHTVDMKGMIATRKRKGIEKYEANVRKKAKSLLTL